MIGCAKLIACLFFYASSAGIRTVEGNIAVLDERTKFEGPAKQVLFKYYSVILNATSQPTVYGCSYHSSGNNSTLDDGICLVKIMNGEVQALVVQNTSDTSLRDIYYPRSSVVNGTYWYIYEVPTSCWRNQEVYATLDGQKYTRLWKYDHVPVLKGAPILRNATFNEKTECMSVEVEALEDGNCTDYQYQIDIMQTLGLKSESCEVCDNTHQWCCYNKIIPWGASVGSFRFNGTLSNSLLNYQHCYGNNIIKMINATYNETGPHTPGLYKIKRNMIFVTVKALIGEISGDKSRIQIISMGTPLHIVNSSGSILGAGIIIPIVSFLIILVQGQAM